MNELYVYEDPDEGAVCICAKCYDMGNSGYPVQILNRNANDDLDRICWFCSKLV
jgi:hypothetical protein